MKRKIQFTISALCLAILIGCSSTPKQPKKVGGYTPSLDAAKQQLEETRPFDGPQMEELQLYVDGHWHSYWVPKEYDSYESEWRRYYQQEMYSQSPEPYGLTSDSITFFHGSGVFSAPYQHYYVEEYFPDSNFSLGVGVSSYGYPGYAPWGYGSTYIDDYNPFWDDQWASYRYGPRYRAGSIYAYPHWWSPYWYDPYWYGPYYSPYLYSHHFYWRHRHYIHFPIVRDTREPRPENPERGREPLVTTSPKRDDETTTGQKAVRENDIWKQERLSVSPGSFLPLGNRTPSVNSNVSPSQSNQRIQPQISNFRNSKPSDYRSSGFSPSSPRLSEPRSNWDAREQIYKGLEYSNPRNITPSGNSSFRGSFFESPRSDSRSFITPRIHTRPLETRPSRSTPEISPNRSPASSPSRSSSGTSARR